MYFNATPTNMVAILITVPGIVGIVQLMRKQYDTNLPLLFYVLAFVFISSAERSIPVATMYGGLGSAMLLRFEFMGTGFTKFIAYIAVAGLAAFAYALLAVPFSFR